MTLNCESDNAPPPSTQLLLFSPVTDERLSNLGLGLFKLIGLVNFPHCCRGHNRHHHTSPTPRERLCHYLNIS